MDSVDSRTKMADYFSTLNSLSLKIFSEVQLIDESIESAVKDKDKELSYDERCAIIDKVLIHDPLVSKVKRRNPVHHLTNSTDLDHHVESVVYKDDCLNRNQTESLLRFVYPKKPEKYVFDETGCWVDEHSEPFSYFKQSQAKCCDLDLLVQRIGQNGNKEKKSERSKVKVDEDSGREDKPRKETKTKPRAPFCGVNVMGGLAGNTLEDKLRSTKDNQDETSNRNSKLAEEEREANLPQQKQNLDLIAELQAKLDKNKSKVMNSTPMSTQGSASPASKSAISGSPMSNKVSKPKAPPPPPPVVAVTKSEVTENRKPCSIQQKSKVDDEVFPTFRENKTDDFVVDVSSPCRIATPKTGFDFLDNW